MTLDELKAVLRDGGVVGAGGAGFPSYAKLDSRADTIILNCAECEPLLKLHRQVLEKYAEEILQTLDLIAKTVGAKSYHHRDVRRRWICSHPLWCRLSSRSMHRRSRNGPA